MGLKCGLVGLPNVGKTMLFSALTGIKAETATNKEANLVLAKVPDSRLDQIVELVPTQKVTPAVVEFVDIAGLTPGASSKEGRKFLEHIREANALIHLVRCFENEQVYHVEGSLDPQRDIELINLELALDDLELCTKRLQTLQKALKIPRKEDLALKPILERCIEALKSGQAIRHIGLSEEELFQIKELRLLTAKPVLYVANVGEGDLQKGNTYTQQLSALAEKEKTPWISVCAQLEAELAQMAPQEQADFFKDLGITEPSLNRLVQISFQLLGLRTFFTAGRKEVRAWMFKAGSKAPKAAAVIHSDFEKGFIRAAVYHCNDLFLHKTEKAIKEAGLTRMEGKDYEVQDGDVMLFHFS